MERKRQRSLRDMYQTHFKVAELIHTPVIEITPVARVCQTDERWVRQLDFAHAKRSAQIPPSLWNFQRLEHYNDCVKYNDRVWLCQLL